MHSRRSILLSLGMAVLPTCLMADEYLPHSALGQNGAYGGLLAAGIGYEFSGIYGVDLLFGYTPKQYAGHAVRNWELKNQIYVYAFEWGENYRLRPYAGLNFVYSPDRELFVRLPKQYPDWYYPPSAVRPLLSIGFDLRFTPDLIAGFEYAVLDSELAYYRDYHYFSVKKMGSGGITLRKTFE